MVAYALDNTHLVEPDEEFEALVASNPMYSQQPTDIQMMRASRARQPPPGKRESQKDVVEEDRTVPARDGYEIPIRIHSPPKAPEGGSSLFVFYHGGGYCLGNLDSNIDLCRSLAADLGAVVVHVNYRLAPEYPFPTGLDDAYDAFKWAAQNAASLKANPAAGFIVGGISAGGNFATVVTHLARDDKIQPPLTGAWLSIPAVIAQPLVPEQYLAYNKSYEQNKDSVGLSQHTIQLFLDAYNGDHESPKFSPLLWPGGHKDLPATYFQVCGGDPLRDEAFFYEHELKEVGIKTKMDVYPGLPHGFWGMAPKIAATAKWEKDCLAGYKWLLEEGRAK